MEENRIFSRRRLLKVGSALFAFFPAALYLSNATDAFAFVPCEEEATYTSCDDWYCVEYSRGYYRYARLCTSYGVKSKQECDSYVDWGREC